MNIAMMNKHTLYSIYMYCSKIFSKRQLNICIWNEVIHNTYQHIVLIICSNTYYCEIVVGN